MSALVLKTVGRAPLFGARAEEPWGEATPDAPGDEPCGGERVIDFALCLIIAAALVGLLLAL